MRIKRTHKSSSLATSKPAPNGRETDAREPERAEERLREYVRLVEGVEEMISVVDRDYRYLVANRAFLKQRGLKSSQVLGRLISEVLNQELFEQVLKPKLDECFQGKVVRFELNRTYPKIGERVLSVSYFPIEGPQRVDRVACVLHDITEQRRAAELLRQSESQLIEAQHLARVGSWSWDLETNRGNWSAELYHIFGLEPGATVPTYEGGLAKYVHPEDKEFFRQAVEDSLSSGEPCDVFYRIVRPDGEERIIHSQGNIVAGNDGKPVRMFGTAQDVTEQKLGERALGEAEKKYREIFENAVEGIFQTSPDGQTLTANPALARMLGFESAAELIAARTNIGEQGYVQPGQRSELRRLIERHGSVQGFEFECYRKDGSIVWISENVRAVRDAGGELLYYEGTVEDVTERKLAEDLLRESERKYRDLVETAHDLIWAVDADGTITFMNQAAREIYGYEAEELIGRSYLDLLSPEERIRQVDRLPELLASGEKLVLGRETEVMDRAGNRHTLIANAVILFDQQGNAIGTMGTSRDVTEHKRAEAELRESEERFSRAFHSNPAPLIITRLDDGRFLNVNDAFLLAFEYERGEVIGETVQGLNIYVNREDRKNLIDKLKEQGSLRGYESQARTKSGRVLDLWVSVEPITLQGQQCILSTAYDVTERKRVEEALRESEERYRDLVENSRDLICTHDLDGLVLSANPAASAAVGYDLDEFVGKKTIPDLLAPEVKDQFDGYMARLRQAGTTSGTMLVQTKSGERRIWEYYNTLRTEGLENPIVRGMARDVTDRKRAEEALMQSEREYRGLFENAHDAILIIHPENEIILEVNQRACDVYRLSRSEFVGMSLETISKNPERGSLRIQETLKQGAVYNFETIHRRGDGTEMLLDINASVVQYKGQTVIQSINRDITDRKQAEDDMSNLRRELELTMNSMQEGIHRVDLNGNIVFENPAAARMLGWEVSELLGKPGHLTMHHSRPDGTPYPKEECPIYATNMDGITRRGADEVFWRKDGTSFPVEYVAAPMRNDRNKIVATVVTFRDITERRRAEAALSESEQELRLFNQATNDLFWNWDFASGQVSRSIGFERTLGYSEAEIDPTIGWWEDRLHPDDRESVITRFQTVIDRGETACVYEYRFRRQDGSYATISDRAYLVRDENGKAFRAIGAMTDITESIRAQSALRQSEERYRSLFENAKDAIYVHDLDGNYTSVNPAAEKLSGYRRDEIIGRNFADFIARENVEQARANLWRKVSEKGGTTYEAEVINKHGTRVPVEVSSRLIFENGVAVGVQGTARDITERKQAETALQTFSRRLIAAQEAERKNIARELHDQIGQMLTALKLNTHAIQRAPDAWEACVLTEDHLKMLDEALEQVRDLSLDLRPLLLDDLGLVTALHWYVERQAQRTGVRTEFTSDGVDADLRFSSELEIACFRIAQEALTNVARHAQAEFVTVRLARDGPHLNLRIKDDGVGFDREALRAHPSANGTLGLRGMEERAQAVGGRICLESASGKGTEILARLPIAPAQAGIQRTQRAKA